jgi:hypothetical protein
VDDGEEELMRRNLLALALTAVLVGGVAAQPAGAAVVIKGVSTYPASDGSRTP